ncbi:MAG: cobaltochelatase subunit CobN, partial [Ferrovibrionaceae bacterium]
TVPTEAAWRLGKLSADRLVQAYVQEHGSWPRQMAISAWGTANMRTGGDDIAQALALIGVQPLWEASSRRVTGFEIVPLGELGRPRIDILFRISGFFRDAFPTQIDLLDSALSAVAALDEPPDSNPLAASPGHRIFGNRPGDYGAGIERRLSAGDWQEIGDLAEAYLATSGYAYGAGIEGVSARAAFERLVARTDVVVQNQDAREFDLLDSADFAEFQGGLSAAATALSGRRPVLYHNDHSRPDRPVIRKLEEEIALALRGRAVNPKWLKAIRGHGYKGGAELAATVDNLFNFAALTGAVAPVHFDLIYDAYLVDPEISDFLARDNPAARRDIARRLAEAITRGLWRPARNSAHDHLHSLAQ